jgi:MarR family transcriptional regulator for hemolysin
MRNAVPPTPVSPAVEVARGIAFARRLVWKAVARRLQSQGESIDVWQVLARLVHGGPTTQRALADAILQHPAAVCRQLREMEGQGLVRRRRHKEDRRKMVVAATPQGRKRFLTYRPFVIEAVEETLRPLLPREQLLLRDLLKKLLESSRESRPKRPGRAQSRLSAKSMKTFQ